MFFHFEYLLYVALPLMLLMGLVQAYLSSTYGRYSRVGNRRGITGAEAARRILQYSGIYDVEVSAVRGFLSDHYDPTRKVLRLSPDNYSGTSLAAVGVAAHEAGHAVQHARKYAPLVLRNLAVPAASVGSRLGWFVIVVGAAMAFGTRGSPAGMVIVWIGIALIASVVLFQLINLPVEFDASRRALALLPETGILSEDEVHGARKVLVAAALTYVAATIAAIAELVYWLWRLGIIGGRR